MVGLIVAWNQKYSINFVDSASMKPTINQNSFLICKKINDKTKLQRGDIVTFRYPLDNKKVYIKRIIGLPGETVTIINGTVSINGDKLEEEYVKNKWTKGIGDYVYQVPQESYFVLGDNRNNSDDSRYWEEEYWNIYGEHNQNISYIKKNDILAVWID
jgi:signal peptidase I